MVTRLNLAEHLHDDRSLAVAGIADSLDEPRCGPNLDAQNLLRMIQDQADPLGFAHPSGTWRVWYPV
jgi:hypothetical protein